MVRWQFRTDKLSGVEGSGLDAELAAALPLPLLT